MGVKQVALIASDYVKIISFPAFLTEETFPLRARACNLLDQAIRSGPGGRCDRPLAYLDSLIVAALTNCGIELFKTKNFDEAQHVLATAIRIQEWLSHPFHEDLSEPLLTLAEIYLQQCRLDDAEPVFLRALGIVAKTDARIQQHEQALMGLIDILCMQGRRDEELQMRASLVRLHGENPFVIKDRPNRRSE